MRSAKRTRNFTALRASGLGKALIGLAAASLILAGCGAEEPTDPEPGEGEETSTGTDEGAEPDESAEPDDDVPSDDGERETAFGRDVAAEWDEIVEEARGTTVNFHMWGGNDNINSFVDDILGASMAEKYDITVNRVPLQDTVEAVNSVLNELQAGVEADGSVDIIWIDGENYFTMNQADAMLTGWERGLPNAELVDWESDEVSIEGGIEVDGMSPWGSAAFQFVYDSDRTDQEDLPSTFADLVDWISANPGQFTYPELPVFHGTRFVEQMLYEVTGGHEQWTDYEVESEEQFLEDSRELWETMQTIDENLWQNGQNYPSDLSAQHQLLGNGEISLAFHQLPAGIRGLVETGVLPESARSFVMEGSSMFDFHYLGIPVNATNPEAALLLANEALEPDMQLEQFDPDGVGWGDGLAISPAQMDADAQQRLDELIANLEPYGLDPAEFEENAVPPANPSVRAGIEDLWDIYVRLGQPLP